MIAEPETFPHQVNMAWRWIAFLILFALFFVGEGYDLFYAVNAVIDEHAAVSSIAAASAGAGSSQRPIAFAALALFGAMCWLTRPPSRPAASDGAFIFLVVMFLGYAALSMTWAWDFDLVLRRVIVLGLSCVAAFGVAQKFSNQDLVLFAFIVGALAGVLGLFGEISSGAFTPWIPEYRFYGIMHANTLGGLLAISVLAAITLARTAQRRRGLFTVAAIIIFGILLLTKSRGATVAGVIAIWVMMFLGARDRKRVMWLSVLVLCLVGPLLGLMLGDALDDMARSTVLLGRDEGSPETLTGRLPLWGYLIERYVGDRPFFGYGYNGFWTPQHVMNVSGSQNWLILTAHSGYVSLLLELGAVGLGLVAIIVVMSLRRSYRNYRRSGDRTWLFMTAVLVWAIVNSIFDVVILEPTLRNFICFLVFAKLALVRPLPERVSAPAFA